MYEISDREKQTARLWLPDFKRIMESWADKMPDITLSIICAIVSRETLWGWASAYKINGHRGEGDPDGRGDYSQRRGEDSPRYHGYGYFQIDIGSHQGFISTGKWSIPSLALEYVLNAVLWPAWERFKNEPAARRLKATIAAYNAGAGNVAKQLKKGTDVDLATTGRNYAADVLDRARVWDKWLSGEGGVIDPPPLPPPLTDAERRE